MGRCSKLRPNPRIETDRRQRRFATLAPSAHAERWAEKAGEYYG